MNDKMRILKKSKVIVSVIMLICFVIGLTAQVSAVEDPEIDLSKLGSVYVYNFEHDMELFTYNPDMSVFPTSTVKLMTAILALENLGDRFDEKVTITEDMLKNVTGNNVGLQVDEVVTIGDLIHALIIGGANDAAYIIANLVSGSPELFVAEMNRKAGELGAVNTNYTNPSGMHHDGMVTTARDTAIIAKYAYSLPKFIEIASMPKYVMPETNMYEYRNIYNRNYLISRSSETKYYYRYATGMNAGSTPQGGYALVATAQKEGLTYLVIIMNAQADEIGDTGEISTIYSYTEAIKLFEWAFANFGYVEVLSSSEMICEIKVNMSSALDYVTLVPEKSLEVYLPTDTDIKNDIQRSYKTVSEELDAPVEEGQVAGMVTIIKDGVILGNINLVTTSAVSRSDFLYMLERIKNFTSSTFFITAAVTAVILSVAYVLYEATRREREARRRNKYRR